MNRFFFYPSALAATLVAIITAIADARADEQCFCLGHSSRQIAYYGCDAQKIPNHNSDDVSCRKDDQSYEMVTVDRPERFPRVKAGVGDCNPCNPVPRTGPTDVLRQPGGLFKQ